MPGDPDEFLTAHAFGGNIHRTDGTPIEGSIEFNYAADVAVTPVTEEEDVRAALTKVRLNEVDAALVYRTDVRSAGEDVEGIAFDEAAAAPNDYPIAVVAGASEPGLAAEWVELLVSQEGAEVLGDAGFTEV